MNSDQWQRVEQLYHEALQCELDARPAFLLQRCNDDQVRVEVAALLNYDSRAENFMQTPAFKRAARGIAAQEGLTLDSLPPRELGPYRLLAPLGRGGMGEVHLALDTRLNRKVALKLLSSAFTADNERVRRFKQEARATSVLSHPNIVTVFEVGEVAGRHFIVSEYVAGETLRQLISSGSGKGLEPHTALAIAAQVVKALQAAHNAGVIHRDIKPENVIVRADGLVKVLDFGLAKLKRDELSESESQSQQLLTRAGVVMGTAAYMSPEQARGQQIDQRTDIFSFGALAYEMFSGERPFTGATSSDVMAAVLIKDPEPLSKVAPQVTAALATVVHRCLEKQAEKRFQSTEELASTLAAASTAAPTGFRKLQLFALIESAAVAWRRARQRPAYLVTAALALVLLSGLAILATGKLRRAISERPPVTTSFKLPEGWGFRRSDLPVVSLDGQMIVVSAFPANDRAGRESALWLRRVDSTEATLLAGTDGGVAPFWSPDSRYVAFWQQEKLKRINISTGAVSTLLDDEMLTSGEAGSDWQKQFLSSAPPSPGAWGIGDIILLSLGSRLVRVTIGGGPALSLDPFAARETGQFNPRFLPDGRHFLYCSRNQDRQDDGIYLASLDTGSQRKLVLKNATAATYVAAGYLLFSREGQLVAQHFDLTRFEVTGDPFALTARLGKDSGSGLSGAPLAAFSASNNGVLVWRPTDAAVAPAQNTSQLTWFDRSGKRLGAIGEPAVYSGPAFSPDEQRLVVAETDPKSRGRDLWVFDLANGGSSRITSDPADEFNPVWSPDGKWIYFSVAKDDRRNIYRRAADGSGTSELLWGLNGEDNVEDISPDGRFLVFNSRAKKDGEPDLTVVSLDGSRKRMPFTATRSREDQAQFSPDGRWVAYRSDESGTSKIVVRGFTRDGRPANTKYEVSNKDGVQPRWSADGKELFYLEGNRLMVVDIAATGEALTNSVPRPLFKVTVESTPRRNRYLVSRDGQRIMAVSLVEARVGSTVVTQINWPATLPR